MWIWEMAAATSIGETLATSITAARARASGLMTHPFLVDEQGELMVTAQATYIDPSLSGVARMTKLTRLTVGQLTALRDLASLDVDLIVCLPEPRPGWNTEDSALVVEVLKGSGLNVVSELVLALGSAGCARAMEAAARNLAEHPQRPVLIACIDSWIHPETLEWLDSMSLLHSDSNRWGFVPSEAAGLILVGAKPGTGHRIAGYGCAEEPNPANTGRLCVGDGLSEAMRSALRGVPALQRVERIYTDMNGEPSRAEEYGFACLRVGRAVLDAENFVAPADCWGDIGAASIPLLLAMACSEGEGASPYHLVTGSSPGGLRGAILAEREARP
jgi:3-oxoacyl-[acyl-carrier-protein] synthase I